MFDAFVMQQMPYIVVVACLWFIAFTCHRFKQHDPDNVGEDSIVRQRLQGVTEGETRKRLDECEIKVIMKFTHVFPTLPQSLEH